MMLFASERRRRGRETAERLYAASVAAAREPALYRDYRVPDTLQGRFDMMALHLFPLLYRLMHDPGDDRELARLLSEAFVADMDAGFRDMGVGDVTVPKRMKTLYSAFAGRMEAYKQALETGEPSLASVIARNIFPDEPEDWRAEALAKYLERAIQAFGKSELDELRQGRVVFPKPGSPDEEEQGR